MSPAVTSTGSTPLPRRATPDAAASRRHVPDLLDRAMTHGARDRAGPKADFAQAGPRRAVHLCREQADLGAVGRERVGLRARRGQTGGGTTWGRMAGQAYRSRRPTGARNGRSVDPDAILGRVSASAKGRFTAEGALVAALLLRSRPRSSATRCSARERRGCWRAGPCRVAMFLGSFAWSFVHVSLPFYIQDLSRFDAATTLRWTGFILGISPLITVITAPISGWLAGSRDPKRAFVWTQGLQAAGFVLMAFARSLGEIFFARCLLGADGRGVHVRLHHGGPVGRRRAARGVGDPARHDARPGAGARGGCADRGAPRVPPVLSPLLGDARARRVAGGLGRARGPRTGRERAGASGHGVAARDRDGVRSWSSGA